MTYENKGQVKSACVPCAVGHFSTSARLLNEAVRFKEEGLKSPQVLDDIAAALGEQNALERIDLTPEKILTLPQWEQGMAQEALDKSREIRHRLETVKNMDELFKIAAEVEQYYKYLNREWQSKRLDDCPDCDKAGVMAEELTHVADEDDGGEEYEEDEGEIEEDAGYVLPSRPRGESPAERRAKLLEDIRKRKV